MVCMPLLFLLCEVKFPYVNAINKIFCAELPQKDDNPKLYEVATKYMMHGPRGAFNENAPCIKDKKCTKRFAKRFNDS